MKSIFSTLFMLLFSANLYADDLHVGQMAPEFSLTDQHHKTHQLKDYRGKWVVLYFYPKDDTPGCTTEACSFRDNINALIAKQAVILGVSVDGIEQHQDFSNKFQLPFSLLSDPEGQVARQYNALLDLKIIRFAKRHSFIIDPQGRIAKIYLDVDPQRHVADVLEDLTELQNDESAE
ncbi:peroxiredoxin [Thiomicrorhabdus sp.]|uniref:peroxiredoxin n=1 Tax=Thiomicrorhabdus sp. TaxID=2039724 RepID=UPI00356319ED